MHNRLNLENNTSLDETETDNDNENNDKKLKRYSSSSLLSMSSSEDAINSNTIKKNGFVGLDSLVLHLLVVAWERKQHIAITRQTT